MIGGQPNAPQTRTKCNLGSSKGLIISLLKEQDKLMGNSIHAQPFLRLPILFYMGFRTDSILESMLGIGVREMMDQNHRDLPLFFKGEILFLLEQVLRF